MESAPVVGIIANKNNEKAKRLILSKIKK